MIADSRPGFIIYSLPRSRTAWLSHFLTYGEWLCGHEEIRHLRGIEDVRSWFSQGNTGTVETAGAPFWRLAQSIAPAAAVVVIRRPVHEVVDSLMAIPGLSFERGVLEHEMKRLDAKLDQIESRIPNVLSVDFSDLTREDVCAGLFEHCLPYRHDHAHWARIQSVNIQINMPSLMRYYFAYKGQLDKLASVARHTMLAAMAAKPAHDCDDLTLQAEAFDTWIADAEPLFKEHCKQVGEDPENWKNKNLPLMSNIYDAGAMQIMTARSNGRMFGYLMTLISPSLSSRHELSATNLTFFASPDFPGLGMKLQRATLAALKERGVSDVFMRAGVRGSGERISTIYKRLGAQDNGREYRLVLTEN